MDVESRKSFRHGFVMRETDLRRLVDTVTEQYSKLPSELPAQAKFGITFRNGAIADNLSIDQVLAEENSGSGQILRLTYEHTGRNESGTQSPSTVTIEFLNADESDVPGYVSVRFRVFGHNRDWVFVTSSLLVERIERIKRFSLNQFSGSQHGLAFPFAFVIGPLMFMFVVLMAYGQLQSKLPGNDEFRTIETQWKGGNLKDPIEAMIRIERARRASELAMRGDIVPLRWFGFAAAGLVVIFLAGGFLFRYYPAYNFCWGEYLDYFTKREAARRFWIVIILVGLVVSVAGSLIANRIHW